MHRFTKILSSNAMAGAAFPFGLVADADMALLEYGQSLSKVLSDLVVGNPLQQYFAIERPRGLEWEYGSFARHESELILLKCLEARELVFRARVFCAEQQIAIDMSPVITDADTPAQLGLVFADFPLTDSITDNMFIWSMHKQMLKEAENLTKELGASNEKLQKEVEIRQSELQRILEIEKEREALQEELILASREAGKAEIATGVLHNVGNVMNSVNVTADLLHDNLQKKLSLRIKAAADLLQANRHDLPAFIQSEQGQKFLPFLSQLHAYSEELMKEVDLLRENVEHVNAVVAAQQAFATLAGMSTRVIVQEVVEASIQITQESLRQSSIELEREFGEPIEATLDKQKLIQVIVNLLRNAKHAIEDVPSLESKDRKIWVSVYRDKGEVVVAVRDQGIGIEAEDLKKIFRSGFTTRAKSGGHGFGLHHSHCTLVEMGGSLQGQSEGKHCGATFTVRLPAPTEGTTNTNTKVAKEYQAT